LVKKWDRAAALLEEATDEYERISVAAGPTNVSEWNGMAKKAQMDRCKDIQAMDIFQVKALTRKFT